MPEPFPAPFLKFEDAEAKEVRLNSGNIWKIGRTEQNTIVLPDEMVSRNHAMIQRQESGEFYLVDMGSRNGSFVNGRRITAPVALKDGDQLAFGVARLCFHHPEQLAATSNPGISTSETSSRGQTIALFKQALVSILVVDIRGFTVLAQKVDAQVLSRMVSTWFDKTDRILLRRGSTAHKHIGDAAMAVWTHTVEGGQNPEIMRILTAVAEIAAMTASLHASLGLAEPLRIGAGINTGLAALGNTGGSGASDFTAIGDSVNAAFRLESATKELGADLVLGDATFDYVRWGPSATSRFQEAVVRLKGYEAPIKAWQISFPALGEFLAQQSNNADGNETVHHS